MYLWCLEDLLHLSHVLIGETHILLSSVEGCNMLFLLMIAYGLTSVYLLGEIFLQLKNLSISMYALRNVSLKWISCKVW